jgi:hypothetical protein
MRRAVILLAMLVLLPFIASIAAYQAGIRISFGDLRVARDTEAPLPDEIVPPPEWREDVYLRLNPDVDAAVRRGAFASGYAHYFAAGHREGRPGGLPNGAAPRPQRPLVAAAPESPAPAPPLPPATPPLAAPPPAVVAAAPPPAPPQPAKPSPAVPPAAPEASPGPASSPSGGEPPPAFDPAAPEYVIRNGGTLQRVADVTGIPLERLRQLNPDLPRGWLPAGSVVSLVERGAAPWPKPAPAPVPAVPPPVSPPASVPLPPPPAVKPAPPPALPAALQPAARVSIEKIRFGMHSGALRVVLDASGPLQFRQSVQPDGRAIVVDLPDVQWNAMRDGRIDDASVLRSFHAEPTRDGTRLTIRTNPQIAVKAAGLFLPVESRGHRLVLDIAPSSAR